MNENIKNLIGVIILVILVFFIFPWACDFKSQPKHLPDYNSSYNYDGLL